jgi:hypothetical protein
MISEILIVISVSLPVPAQQCIAECSTSCNHEKQGDQPLLFLLAVEQGCSISSCAVCSTHLPSCNSHPALQDRQCHNSSVTRAARPHCRCQHIRHQHARYSILHTPPAALAAGMASNQPPTSSTAAIPNMVMAQLPAPAALRGSSQQIKGQLKHAC